MVEDTSLINLSNDETSLSELTVAVPIKCKVCDFTALVENEVNNHIENEHSSVMKEIRQEISVTEDEVNDKTINVKKASKKVSCMFIVHPV